MPRALLAYPEFPETFWGYQRALKFLGLRATHPPLGLLTVAGLLPEEFEIRLVDLNVESLRDADCRWADIVLTGGMMIQRASVEKIVRQCRRADVPVVIGGPDATSCAKDFPEDVHLVLGEAESPRLQGALSEMITAQRRIVLDLRDDRTGLDDSPLPRYDLLDMNQYASMALQISRGCPFKCEFCDIPTLFGNRTRYKSAERTRAELDLLFERGWRGSVFWVDDNFIGNKKSCKEILPHVVAWQRERGMPFQFYTQASINLAGDPQLLALMTDAGFDSVFLGIETPIEESLRETKKLQNVRFDLLEAVRTIQGAGMEVMGGFIIGFDHDPSDIDRHLIGFIQEAGLPVAMTGLLTVVPGSPLHDRFEREGRLLETDAARGGNNTFEFDFNFKTAQDPEVLIAAYTNVLDEVYGKPESYFRRVETLFRHLGGRPRRSAALSWRRVRALLRSILMIPTSRYGWSYGKFLLRTIPRHPARFPDAVRLGIVGKHFYQLTKERLAAHEFASFVSGAIERLRESYAAGWHEGLESAAHVLADCQHRLRLLPTRVRREVQTRYHELTAHELRSFITGAAEHVKRAYTTSRRDGLALASQVLAAGRKRMRALPAAIRKEMRVLYQELELELNGLTTKPLPTHD